VPDDLVAWALAQPTAPALLALLIDRAWPRRRAAAPAFLMSALGAVVGRLNRADRPPATRQTRGFLLWALCSLLALFLGAAVAGGLADHLGQPWSVAVETALLAAGIGYQAARATARRAVDGVAGLTQAKGEFAAAPVAAEACRRLAARLADGAVALVLAWLLLGLPGVFLVKAGQWLVLAVERDREGAFGRAVRACHGLVTLPSAWLAGILLSPGHGAPLALGPEPATAAMAAALDRAGLDTAMPSARVAAARSLADQAHATWFCVLLAGTVLALVLS
jgi:hypothetical protein